MPEPTIYTFLPPIINKLVCGLLETGQTIRTKRIVIKEESCIAHTYPSPGNGYFVTTSSGSRYNLIVLPISAFQVWLVDFLGIQPKEAVIT